MAITGTPDGTHDGRGDANDIFSLGTVALCIQRGGVSVSGIVILRTAFDRSQLMAFNQRKLWTST